MAYSLFEKKSVSKKKCRFNILPAGESRYKRGIMLITRKEKSEQGVFSSSSYEKEMGAFCADRWVESQLTEISRIRFCQQKRREK